MNRRQTIATLGTLVVGFAGCSGSGSESEASHNVPVAGSRSADDDSPNGGATVIPQLNTTDFTVKNGTDGRVQVDIFVSNPAELTRNSVAVVSVSSDSGTVEGRSNFSIAPGKQTTVSVTLPLEYEAWTGSLDINYEYQQ